jgi:uncharacterized protein
MAVNFQTFPAAECIDKNLWNGLADDSSPMMEWEYYYCLEQSGSVSPHRGYQACHLVAYENGRPVALAPLYERDRAWVEFGDGGLIEFLSELTGLPFHKGLVGTIPFTPVPGYQFLHHPAVDSLRAGKILLDYIDYRCQTQGYATARIYFLNQSSALHSLLSEQGYIRLRSEYSEWFNRGFSQFDDYLGTFKSSRRTKIKRELRDVHKSGISVEMIEGCDAPMDYYRKIYQLYVRTWEKHMGTAIPPFLNEAFFELIGRHFVRRSSFSVAWRAGEEIAMALFYHKARILYGRYWGYFEDVPFLHFATCYYHPIEYAIKHGFLKMDPGFGGEHKLIRGFETVPVYHYIKFYGEQQRRIASMVLKQVGIPFGKPYERA